MTTKRREQLEDRWRVITTRPKLYLNDPAENVSLDNCKEFYRVTDSVKMLAGHILEDGISGEDEGAACLKLQEDVWQAIEDRVLAFAEQIDQMRAPKAAAS